MGPKRTFVYLVVLTLSFFLTACGGGGSSNNNNGGTPPPSGGSGQVAPSVTFTASPSAINTGQSATLTWTTANATSVSIDNGVGAQPVNGSVTVTPAATTTYTLTATGTGGTTTATTTVTVSAGAAISLTSSQASQAPGEMVTLTWSSTNIDTVTFSCSAAVSPACRAPFDISDDDEAPPGPNGSTTVQLPGTGASTPVTYTITGTGPLGTATSSVVITDDPAFPTLHFAASPSDILPGQSTKLFWNTTNVSSVTIDNGVGAVANPAGDTVTVSPTATTTYTATAVGTNGATIFQQVTVNEPAAGAVGISLKTATPAIGSGQSATLQWVSVNAATVSIDNGVGPQSASGSANVSPSGTTTYTATATDAAGNKASSVARVTVVSSGDPNQVKHIIIMMQENRSLDNYFGQLDAYRAMRGVGGTFDGLPKDPLGNFLVAIPDNAGNMVKPYHLQTVCTDNSQPSWNQSHADYDNGKMDGFLKKTQANSNDPNGHRSIGFYDQTELPYYYEAATQFATSDRYYSSVMAPTVINRMYMFSATSHGHIQSDKQPAGGWPWPTIFQRLREAGVTFRIYFQDNTVFLAQFSDWPIDKSFVYPISRYFTDIQNPATLPQVIFIERGSELNNDEHPLNNIQTGATFVKSTLDALMASPSWKESAYILNYDEGGGLYDHVPPMDITAPDGIAPIPFKGMSPGDFTKSGFRVPIIVISPFSKQNYVSHTSMDHTAILKTIEARFGVSALTARDAASPDMFEFFNFSSPSFMTAPSLPAQPTTGTCDKKLEAIGSQ
jgi:phospholipase C